MTGGSKGHRKRVIEDEMSRARFGTQEEGGQEGDVRHLRLVYRARHIASAVNIFAFGRIYAYVVSHVALLPAAGNSIVLSVSISVRNSKRGCGEALN